MNTNCSEQSTWRYEHCRIPENYRKSTKSSKLGQLPQERRRQSVAEKQWRGRRWRSGRAVISWNTSVSEDNILINAGVESEKMFSNRNWSLRKYFWIIKTIACGWLRLNYKGKQLFYLPAKNVDSVRIMQITRHSQESGITRIWY